MSTSLRSLSEVGKLYLTLYSWEGCELKMLCSYGESVVVMSDDYVFVLYAEGSDQILRAWAHQTPVSKQSSVAQCCQPR